MCVGAEVSWVSRTHKYVTLSTTEAEYVAMSEYANDAFLTSVVRGILRMAFPDRAGQYRLGGSPCSFPVCWSCRCMECF